MTQPQLFETQTAVNQYGYPIEPESLVDATKMSRRTDPATSKESAAQVACGLSAIEAVVISTVRTLARPATAMEIASAACPDNHARRETIRKRVGELTRPAFFRNGRRRREAWLTTVGERKCDVSGKAATTFEVVR